VRHLAWGSCNDTRRGSLFHARAFEVYRLVHHDLCPDSPINVKGLNAAGDVFAAATDKTDSDTTIG
jgi:hypothetical protein